MIAGRLEIETADDPELQLARYQQRVSELRASPIALSTQIANDQHYELPEAFFRLVLGKHLKYSACLWEPDAGTLDIAEARMLELYASRAELEDGQEVLDLGCGWGSFTLWAATRFPRSRFTAVSNSTAQRKSIERNVAARKLDNVEVITADVNNLVLKRRFDRVVSVEMFEHVRNYALLMKRISVWLTPQGKLFVHIFCHKNLLYPFETTSDGDWMGRYFFTDGLMPAADTLLYFQEHLRLERQWQLSGANYRRTARAWLDNLDGNSAAARSVLAKVYVGRGGESAATWYQRWRMFFMACEEMFGYRGGSEWLVCHYRFCRR